MAPKTKKRLVLTMVLITAAVLAIGGTIFYFYQKYQAEQAMMHEALDPAVYYEGVSVAGIPLGGKTREQAKQLLREKEPELRAPISIVLSFGKKEYTYTTDDFLYTYDTDRMLEEAFQVARTGDLKQRYEAYEELAAAPKDFPVTATLDFSSAEEKVAAIASELNSEVQEAKLLKFTPGEENPFSYQKGKDGVKIKEAETLKALEALLQSETKQGTVEVVAEVQKCKTTTKDIEKLTCKLTSFSTVANNTEDARYNMKKALSSFNGTILEPGEEFSYNRTVGNSSLPEDGWRSASTLSGGKVVQDYGGGVCQAATTLYGAVLRANLTVTDRDCHRWPSSYVPIGQDATISYGNIDFCFENPYDTPVYIEAYMDDVTLHVNIYGPQPDGWDTIEVVSWETETVKPEKTIRKDDPSLPKGEEEEDVESRNGYRAAGEKVFYKDGEQVDSESISSSYYRPVQGVVRVGTKTS